jgi:hypothetical protein
MIKYDAIIRDYSVLELGPRHKVIIGKIYDDSKSRFNDGDVIKTSVAIDLNEEDGYVRTRNTMYKLENKAA